MEDRNYQPIHIDRIIESVSTKRKVCGQLPTGGGKTVEFTMIADRYIRNTGKAVLILVHRKELMYQAQKTIKRMLGIDAYLITSKTKKYSINRIYIGMVDSTITRTHMFDNVGLVIIDECHIANFNKVHSLFMDELIIGFTATPISSSKKDPLHNYYHDIIVGPQIRELIELGYLAQNITRSPKEVVDSTKFEIDNRRGDYNENQMAAEYRKPKFVTNVIENYYKFCFGTKTLIFNVNIEHSKEVTRCFELCNYNARHLDSSTTDDERAEILKWFKETPDAILCSVMIPTVGFDEPTVQNIILNFSTLSVVKFLQCSGRGGRPITEYTRGLLQPDYPYKLELKNHFNIIDMGGNSIRFGDWNDDRDWAYIFNHPPKPGDGVAPVKTCPKCEGLVHASTMICPLYQIIDHKEVPCHYEWEKKKSAKEQNMEEMILITKGIDVDKLITKNQRKYDYFTFLEMGHDVVTRMYTENEKITHNIRIKYFNAYYQLCINWYNKTLAHLPGYLPDITNSSWHMRLAVNNFNSLISKHKKFPELKENTEYPKVTIDSSVFNLTN